MSWRLLPALCVPLALALGCGGGGNGMNGDPLEGTYSVSSHTRNIAGCDMKGPDVAGANPFFRLLVEERFGSEQLSFYGCATPDSCNPAPSTTLSGTDPDGDGWSAEYPSVVSFTGTDCDLSWTTISIHPDGDDVRIESTAETGSVPISSMAQCVNDLVDTNRTLLVCTQLEVIVGTMVTL